MNVFIRGGIVLSCAATVLSCDRMGDPKDRPADTTTTGATTAFVRANDQLERTTAEKKMVDEHIATFDDLDFNVFSKQRWNEFSKSHAEDVTVHWPDGHVTKGLEKHIEDMKTMFTYAPDTRIPEHTIKLGSGDLTSVIGILEGTFTRPMSLGNGKMAAPTKKAFKLTMNTVAHWRGAVMDEEYLFWDNDAFMKQIGVTPPVNPP